MVALSIATGWVAIGAVAVALMRRRGHDTFAWAVLFLFLGPVAIPIAVSSDRHRPAEPLRPLPPGGLDVLVSYDGSPDAQAALNTALTLMGTQMTSITLAAVVDLEAPSTVRGRETQREAQELLDTFARDVATLTAAPVATIILFGEPAAALHHFAAENGYELIVAGSRLGGRALVAGRKTGRTPKPVPVLIGPVPS